jgi:hypothetical protein
MTMIIGLSDRFARAQALQHTHTHTAIAIGISIFHIPYPISHILVIFLRPAEAEETPPFGLALEEFAVPG